MRAGWIATIALVSACSRPHVTLPTIPPDLPPDQRVQVFNDLHATGEKTVTTTSCNGMGGCSTNVDKTLFLANGTRVYHAEDLLPVVGPESTTAGAVRDMQESRRKARVYSLISIASAVGFIGIVVFSFRGDNPGFSTPAELGLLATGAGVLVGGFGAWWQTRQAVAHWADANEGYNEGLAQRLNVCTNGLAVVPCETGVPPPQPQPGPIRPIH
jgi:hypothetical protein